MSQISVPVDRDDAAWGFVLGVKQAEQADDVAARRAVVDASATAVSQDDVERAGRVGIAVQADPKGCSRSECGMTVVLTNRSPAASSPSGAPAQVSVIAGSALTTIRVGDPQRTVGGRQT